VFVDADRNGSGRDVERYDGSARRDDRLRVRHRCEHLGRRHDHRPRSRPGRRLVGQGRVIVHAESLAKGTARPAFTIPKTAKGKLLKVRVTIKAGGQSATKIATFEVR
jgi:hypothetical protein